MPREGKLSLGALEKGLEDIGKLGDRVGWVEHGAGAPGTTSGALPSAHLIVSLLGAYSGRLCACFLLPGPPKVQGHEAQASISRAGLFLKTLI